MKNILDEEMLFTYCKRTFQKLSTAKRIIFLALLVTKILILMIKHACMVGTVDLAY